MTCQIDSSTLRTAVSEASQIVRRVGLPIFECLQLSASDNSLRITGTDGDVMARSSRDAAVAKPFEVCVLSQDLVRLCAGLQGVIELSATVDMLEVRSAIGRFDLPINPDPFPIMRAKDDPREILVSAKDLKAAATFCEPRGDIVNRLGVYLEDDCIFAMGGVQAARFNGAGGSGQCIPGAHVPIIAKCLDADGRLFITDDRWKVEREGFKAVGKLVEATSPPWRQALNAKPFQHVATFEVDDLLAASSMASLGRCDWLVIEFETSDATVIGDRFNGALANTGAKFRCEADHPSTVVFTAADIATCLAPFKGTCVSLSQSARHRRFSPVSQPDVWSVSAHLKDHRNTFNPKAAA